MRHVSAYVEASNLGNTAVYLSYEAEARAGNDPFKKTGTGRTLIGAHRSVGPIKIGTYNRVCGPGVKVTIRVHAKVGAARTWGNWSSAATSQCWT